MSSFTIRFHPAALSEAEKSQSWYSERSLKAANGFVEELSHAVNMVTEAPNRWPKYQSETRRYIFARYPFSLIYRVKNNIIEVLAIAHHRKRPGYWAKR